MRNKQEFNDLINDKNAVIIIEDKNVTFFHKITKETFDLGTLESLEFDFLEIRDCYKLVSFYPNEFLGQARIAEWIFKNQTKEKEQKKQDDLILSVEFIN